MMNIYDLSRKYWDFAFENPDKIKPNHTATYFFAIEHCNRLGWKEKFGFPTSMAMEAIGIKSYNTFIKTLKDLVDFGFIIMIEKSKNQYSSNIIALSNFNNAQHEALDKALIKHSTKQSESIAQSTGESNDSIDIPINNNTNLPITNILLEKELKEKNGSEKNSKELSTESKERKKVAPKKEKFKPPSVHEVQQYCHERQNRISAFSFVDKGWKVGNQPMKDWKAAVRTWETKNKQHGKSAHPNTSTEHSHSTYPATGSYTVSGKISARTLLAQRFGGKTTGNNESGNLTIDAQVVE
ncbi:hypothetical protein D1632_10665 [Chryseobacterium nematophagum]|uniref:Uncharacterized protein n=1 Tax=Chryseobacterium nematophagum TaxID=2305228 RepID=A0A3M7LD88_9FLAO|nr:hypothetical protein [Chryseobacterium nematophagum]RMZ60045.1 hypothetical protein D1632_10665 [Chryseobacterium nematophagum]